MNVFCDISGAAEPVVSAPAIMPETVACKGFKHFLKSMKIRLLTVVNSL
jgi:hypothetical protein